MGKRLGKYTTRTEDAVKQALLKLLARKPLSEVSVSELCREAHISRSTFYEHFGNPGDAYDALVADAMGEMSPLMSQVACSDRFRPSGKPFCALVRDTGDYAPRAITRQPCATTAFSIRSSRRMGPMASMIYTACSQVRAIPKRKPRPYVRFKCRAALRLRARLRRLQKSGSRYAPSSIASFSEA